MNYSLSEIKKQLQLLGVDIDNVPDSILTQVVDKMAREVINESNVTSPSRRSKQRTLEKYFEEEDDEEEIPFQFIDTPTDQQYPLQKPNLTPFNHTLSSYNYHSDVISQENSFKSMNKGDHPLHLQPPLPLGGKPKRIHSFPLSSSESPQNYHIPDDSPLADTKYQRLFYQPEIEKRPKTAPSSQNILEATKKRIYNSNIKPLKPRNSKTDPVLRYQLYNSKWKKDKLLRNMKCPQNKNLSSYFIPPTTPLYTGPTMNSFHYSFSKPRRDWNYSTHL